MRLLVCGGRDYADREKVFAVLDEIHAVTPVDVIVEPGSMWSGWLAFIWAGSRSVGSLTLSDGGRTGDPKHNQRMLDDGKPDLVVVFPGGDTSDMVRRAKKAGLEVRGIR